jgi:DNA polymerase III delta subunit
VDGLTDAWGKREVAGVLGACEAILERSTRSGSGEILMLVGRLAAHVRRIQACRRLDAEGGRPRDAAGQLKMHPFAAEKAFAQARNFSEDELREGDRAPRRPRPRVKGGSRLPAELELQRTLVAITRPA